MTKPTMFPSISRALELQASVQHISILQKMADAQTLEAQRISENEQSSGREFTHIQAEYSDLCRKVTALKARFPPVKGLPMRTNRPRQIATTPRSALTAGLRRLDTTISILAKRMNLVGRELPVRNHLQLIAYQELPASVSVPSSLAPCAQSSRERASRLTTELATAITRDTEINTPSIQRHVSHMQADLLQYANALEELNRMDSERTRIQKFYEDRSLDRLRVVNNINRDFEELKNHYWMLLHGLEEKIKTIQTEIASVSSRVQSKAARLAQKKIHAEKKLKRLAIERRQETLDMILARKAVKREIANLKMAHFIQTQTLTISTDNLPTQIDEDKLDVQLALQITEIEESNERTFKERHARFQVEQETLKSVFQATINETNNAMLQLKNEQGHELARLHTLLNVTTVEFYQQQTNYSTRCDTHKEMLSKHETVLKSLLEEETLSRAAFQKSYSATEQRLQAFEDRRKENLARLSHPAPIVATVLLPLASRISSSLSTPLPNI